MADMTECPKCGRVSYSFLHVCRTEDVIAAKYDDEDLREWSERIWAAVEYNGNGITVMKRILAEIEGRV